MDLTYKKIASESSLQYRSLRLESLKMHPSAFEANYAKEEQNAELMFERYIKKQDTSNFVIGAFNGATIIGICGFVNRNTHALDNTGTMIQMYVKDKYQGKNIGLGLTNKLIEEASKIDDISHILLEVNKENSPAINVYKKAGFKALALVTDPSLICMATRAKHSLRKI